MKRVPLIFTVLGIMFFSLFKIDAQELNCTVQINSQKVRSAEQSIFRTLENAIFEFMNSKKWTSDVFGDAEKIECSIFISIESELGQDKYSANVTLQASRPVFNTSYNTVLLNFVDKDWTFEYVEHQPIEYSDNIFVSNLTSMLAFYAYYIIGLDYESFSKNGGGPYLEKAEAVLNTVPSNVDAKGWKPFDGLKNRYWLITDILNSRYSTFREAMYQYHFQAMDKFYDDPTLGRKAAMKAVKNLEKIYDDKPGSVLVSIFMDAHSDELMHIFQQASPNDKMEAINILAKIDPKNADKYDGSKK